MSDTSIEHASQESGPLALSKIPHAFEKVLYALRTIFAGTAPLPSVSDRRQTEGIIGEGILALLAARSAGTKERLQQVVDSITMADFLAAMEIEESMMDSQS